MSFSQTNTTNPLEIKKIARHQIELIVNRDTSGRAKTFVVNNLALEDLQLPDNGRIKLFAYSKRSEQSVDLGMVNKRQLGVAHPFTIDIDNPFHFRLIICAPDHPNILAACEGLRATEETDEAGRQPLLPVEPSDTMGERLWELRLEGDGDPVLFVNNDPDISMLARLRGDPLFQALILPQAVEQVLLQLSQNSGEDGEESWRARWSTYLTARGVEPPEDPDDDDACLTWARTEAQRFANEHKLLTHARTTILEASDDG